MQHLYSCQQGINFSKSFICKIEYTLQIVGLHVQISTLGSSALVIGNLPRYQGAICAGKHLA